MNISFPPTSPSYAQIRAYRVRATRIYQKLEALYPQAKIALDFDNHFQLLVAVMLSAQATDISVNKVTQNLLIMRNLSMFLKHLEKNAILTC